MNLRLTKANAFQIEPGKKYVVTIIIDPALWAEPDKEAVRSQLQPFNMQVVFLPKGSRVKMAEANDEPS